MKKKCVSGLYACVCMNINKIKHSAGNWRWGLFFKDCWQAEPKHTMKVKMYASVLRAAVFTNTVQLVNQRVR